MGDSWLTEPLVASTVRIPPGLTAALVADAERDVTLARTLIARPELTDDQRRRLIDTHPATVESAWLTSGHASHDALTTAATDRRIAIREAVAAAPRAGEAIWRAAASTAPHKRVVLALAANWTCPPAVAYAALVELVEHDPAAGAALLDLPDGDQLVALCGGADDHDRLARWLSDHEDQTQIPAVRLAGDLPGLSFSVWTDLAERYLDGSGTGGATPTRDLARWSAHDHLRDPAGIAYATQAATRWPRAAQALRRSTVNTRPWRSAAHTHDARTARTRTGTVDRDELLAQLTDGDSERRKAAALALLTAGPLTAELVVEIATAAGTYARALVTSADLTGASVHVDDTTAVELCVRLAPMFALEHARTSAAPGPFVAAFAERYLPVPSGEYLPTQIAGLLVDHGHVGRLPVARIGRLPWLTEATVAHAVKVLGDNVGAWRLLDTLLSEDGGSDLTLDELLTTATTLSTTRVA